MTSSRRLGAVILGSLAILMLTASSGCENSSDRTDTVPLRVGYRLTEPGNETSTKRYETLAAYLEWELRIPVELVAVVAYAPSIEALRVGSVDLISLGSMQYLAAEAEGLARAIIMETYADGREATYRSVFIVPAESPLETLEQAVEHAPELELLFTDPRSTSGLLVPTLCLNRIGASSEEFGTVRYSGSHALSILTVAHAEADLAAVSENRLNWLIENGKINPRSVRVIGRSPDIPQGPFAVRTALPESRAKALVKAFLKMQTEAPEVWHTFFPDAEEEQLSLAAYDPEVHRELRPFVRGDGLRSED